MEQVEGKWMQFRGKVRQTWGKFTDNNQEIIAGKGEVLKGELQEKCASSREKVKEKLDAVRKELT